MHHALEHLNLSSSFSPTVILGLAIVILLAVLRTARARVRGRPPLPPGPPPEPILGHYRVVPQDAAFKRYAEWAREYSTTS